MIYVALLRGINVGGKNKVSMVQLKELFTGLGFSSVTTYINSGNIVFKVDREDAETLQGEIAAALEKAYPFKIALLLRSADEYREMVSEIPDHLRNDQEMRTDVIHLFPAIDREDILGELPIKEEIDHVQYIPGAVLWSVDRDKVTKSKMSKIIGGPLYQQMTVRNINTVRKLYEIMEKVNATGER